MLSWRNLSWRGFRKRKKNKSTSSIKQKWNKREGNKKKRRDNRKLKSIIRNKKKRD